MLQILKALLKLIEEKKPVTIENTQLTQHRSCLKNDKAHFDDDGM